MEFESLNAELAFFRRHGLHVEEVTIEVALRPGQLMVFDNLALAHGRRGRRQPASYTNGCSVIDSSVRLISERCGERCSARSPHRRRRLARPAMAKPIPHVRQIAER